MASTCGASAFCTVPGIAARVEMDLIVGRFADANLATLPDSELDEFERLIDVPDPDLYASLTGARPLPELEGGAVYIKLKAFHDSGKAVP